MSVPRVQVSGSPQQVRAAIAILNAANGNGNATLHSDDGDVPSSCGCSGACSCSSGNSTNASGPGNCAAPPGPGALATVSDCLTTGVPLQMCAPGAFPMYSEGGPLYVTKTPTRRDFDIPCPAAEAFLSRTADLCESENSILTSFQLGSGCPAPSCGTNVEAVVDGNSAHVAIAAPGNCDYFTPGILFTVGFSQNTSPGPVSLSVRGVGSDGCNFEILDIRMLMRCLGSGQLALLFGCVVDQRLYPVLARLRTDIVQIPAGATIPVEGGAPITVGAPGVLFPNEELTIDVTGPAGTTITIETLTLQMPALSCLWDRVLGRR